MLSRFYFIIRDIKTIWFSGGGGADETRFSKIK